MIRIMYFLLVFIFVSSNLVFANEINSNDENSSKINNRIVGEGVDSDGDGISDRDEKILDSNVNASTYYNSFFQLSSSVDGVYTDNGLDVAKSISIGDTVKFSFEITNLDERLRLVDVESDNSFLQCKTDNNNSINCKFIVSDTYKASEVKIIYPVFQIGEHRVKIPIDLYLGKLVEKPIGKISINSTPIAVAQKDNIAYVASFDDAQIKLYDISNPKEIKYLKSIRIGEATITDLFIDNQRMYVALGSEGVAIIDVSDAKNPKIIKAKEIQGREYWDIFGQSLKDKDYSIGKEYVYAVDNKAGKLDIFDSNLNIVKTIDIETSKMPIRVYAVTEIALVNSSVQGRYIFISNQEKGLTVYYIDKDFKNIQQIYTNNQISPSDVRGELDTLGSINGVINYYQDLIIYGSKTYKLRVSDNKVDNIQEIQNTVLENDKYVRESINTSGEVDNRFDGYWAGNYAFNNVTDMGLNKSIKTECYGSIVTKGDYLLCANKNSKMLEIYSLVPTKKFLHFDKGWNLVALPINSEVNVNDFNNSKILWKYTNNKWEGWSSDNSIMNKLNKFKNEGKINVFNKIEPAEGFWAYYDNVAVKVFDGKSYDFKNVDLKPGWNLVGSGQSISVDDLNNSNIRFIWKYKNGKWMTWGKDLNQNIYKEYEMIKNIDVSEGFWTYCK